MKGCTTCHYHSQHHTIPPCNYCILSGDELVGWKAITNADKIREMSDEELAKFMCDLTGDCYNCPGDGLCFSTQSPYSNAHGLNVWLKEEAKE